MQIVQAIWVLIFFLFALILLFVWSKLLVISRKMKTITTLVESISGMARETSSHSPSVHTAADANSSSIEPKESA